jgi:hypothetical protein
MQTVPVAIAGGIFHHAEHQESGIFSGVWVAVIAEHVSLTDFNIQERRR